MDVVLYLRYSSDAQNEQSIEGQRRVCSDFCRAQGHTIVGEYVDRATSASHDTEKRLSFQRMIREASAHQFEGVIVYKLDRFARNRYDSAIYKAKLSKAGVRLISATEPISDSPEGIILESVLEGMAEYYSKELSQKVRRGMRETALKGRSYGGAVPLGYRIQDHKLVEDPVTAPIVREAFARYAAGERIADINRDFNARGLRTPTGKEFGPNTWHTAFHNRRYLGIYIYDGEEQPGLLPQLIDEDTFQAVQERARTVARQPAHGKATEPYLLAEKAFCGHCGSPLIGESGHGRHGVTYQYYTCAARKADHSCSLRPIPKDTLERIVAEDAARLISSPDLIEELADMAVRAAEREAAQDSILPALREELKDVTKRIENLLRLVERGSDSPSLLERLDALDAEKKAVLRRIEAAEAEQVGIDRAQVIWFLTTWAAGDIDDPDFRRRIILMLVNSVTVWDEDPDGPRGKGRSLRISIAYNLTDGTTHTFRVSPSAGVSDMTPDGSPSEAYPNHGRAVLAAGRILLHTFHVRA